VINGDGPKLVFLNSHGIVGVLQLPGLWSRLRVFRTVVIVVMGCFDSQWLPGCSILVVDGRHLSCWCHFIACYSVLQYIYGCVSTVSPPIVLLVYGLTKLL